MPTIRFRFSGLLAASLFLSLPCRLAKLDAQVVSPGIERGVLDPSADSGQGPEETTVRALRVQWRRLFNDGSWADLDSVAERLRSQRLRIQGGGWQLRLFYATVSPAGPMTAEDAAWETQIARLQEWAQHQPTSPTPRIALANAYLTYAWKARGNGFSNTVTQEGWKLFGTRVQQARAALEDAAKISSNDPEWYRAMQTVALAQGWNRTQVDTLVDAALNTEPGYFYFARAEANYLLPKWYGQPGDTEAFAEKVADRISGTEGDATYFLIAATVNCCRKTQAPTMSWARVRQGYFALEQLYGTNNYQRNAIAFLALRAGDQQTAQQAFAKIGNDWDQTVWFSKVRFDASRTGKALGNVQPVQPDANTATEAGH
jgi:hypothetical protein